MKYLVVKLVSGLANRIRVLEASYNYAQVHGAKLTIIWGKNFFLNAPYEDCFEAVNGATLINLNCNGTSVFAKLRRTFFDNVESAWLSFFTSVKKYDDDIDLLLNNTEPTEKSKVFFDELAKHNRGVFLETCYEFYPNEQQYHLRI